MVYELAKPLEPSRRSIQRDQRVAIQILTLAIGSVEIRRRRSGGCEHEAAIDVDAQKRPRVRSGAVLPAVALPRLHARLARARHGVKGPEQLSAARVPSANIAVQTDARFSFSVRAPGDHHVFVDDRRRDQHQLAVDVAAYALLQIDESAGAEVGRERSGLRVERHHSAVTRARVQARRSPRVARPVRDTATAHGCVRVARPDLLSCFWFEREDDRSAGHVHDAVDDERRDLQILDSRVEGPDSPQARNVLPRNLSQRREPLRAGIAAERAPVGVRVGAAAKRQRHHSCDDESSDKESAHHQSRADDLRLQSPPGPQSCQKTVTRMLCGSVACLPFVISACAAISAVDRFCFIATVPHSGAPRRCMPASVRAISG